jgi:valyl-tRNA synthetase
MLDRKYQAAEIEEKWRNLWEEQGVYNYDPNETRENTFVIDTPPPTVSGLLHMGHVFSYTQADFIARFQRMIGKNVFYPMGFDDNGLPTERLVEKVKGVKAVQVGRQKFIELCEEVVAESEKDFRSLFKSIALSVDWRQEYQTVSERSRKLSQMSFLDLYNKGLLERRYAPSFWDPVDRTAIAQAEIEDKERQSLMHDIKFATKHGEDIIISTTRPEMLPACVAVLYHPEDGRYKHLKGKHAIVPISLQEVPFVADEEVLQEKGTGLVMCCTFGDIQDIEWWKRHNLPLKQCVDLAGKMCNTGAYDGLKVEAARSQIVEDLKAKGAWINGSEVTQFVKCAERSKAVLEIVPTQQWYIKVLDKKEEFLAKSAECNWHPQYMKVRMDNWIKGLNQDWCISRQRYFGVPIPAWYSKRKGEEGKVLLPNISQLPINPLVDLPLGYSADEVEADADVMDTWATSAISPQLSSLGISDDLMIDAKRHAQLFPADLRPQAHEIIRTWGFYTIVKALYHQGVAPWKNLMISGWCLAADKTKMSKSKGNVVTPEALIIEKGSDVVRYWASNSKLGTDIVYSEEVFKIGKKLATKLWNSAKFVAMHLGEEAKNASTIKEDIVKRTIHCDLDLWVLSKLYKAIEQTTAEFSRFEYADARAAIEGFFWNDFCDNYLEMVKVRVYDESAADQKGRLSAVRTMYHCLNTLLRLFAPIMPSITDELYEMVFGGKSVHSRGNWPKLEQYYLGQESLIEAGQSAVAILELVRKAKSTENVSLKAELSLVEYYSEGTELSASLLKDLANAANAHQVIAIQDKAKATLVSEDEKYAIRAVFAEGADKSE